ncbi:J domain-containing protein [Thalassospira sp. MA62]|nr:J domain-containing protein [Thalassospira sp. MA62]
MQWLVLGIAIFVAVGFFIRWMSEAEPRDIRKIGFTVIIVILVVLAGWLLLTGKIAAMAAALVAALPFLGRVLKFGMLWPLLRRILSTSRRFARPGQFGTQGTGASGDISEIRTEFLHMQLDLGSGQMRGTVLKGRFEGADLDRLGLEDLKSLYFGCRQATDQSQTVLEAYLDRRPDCSDWRNWDWDEQKEDTANAGGNGQNEQEKGQSDTGTSSSDTMTADTARKILGVGRNATRDEINRAYKTRIKQVHPDHGGSDQLASEINAARSLLLRLCKDWGK